VSPVARPYSILIPHYSTPESDEALHLCIRMLRENSLRKDYELIVVQGYRDPYVFWNEYAERAKHEALAFFNNDMLPAPGWDEFPMKHLTDDALIMGYLVEPGVIAPADQNIRRDFGRRPSTFRRKEFEDFCTAQEVPEVSEQMGWYMPVALTKSFFRRMGGYPIQAPFPHPNDIAFWDHCRAQGARLLRVRSFAYHFQGMSNPENDRNR
jgi:hypothetical protein